PLEWAEGMAEPVASPGLERLGVVDQPARDGRFQSPGVRVTSDGERRVAKLKESEVHEQRRAGDVCGGEGPGEPGPDPARDEPRPTRLSRDRSEQEVSLGHGEYLGRFRAHLLTVDPDLVRVGIDLDFGRGVVALHVVLADGAR